MEAELAVELQRRIGDGEDRSSIAGAMAVRAAADAGLGVDLLAPELVAAAGDPIVAPGLLTPTDLGPAYESLLGASDRHDEGVHYTPTIVADGLARLVFAGHPAAGSDTIERCRFFDPTVGGGAFVLAAANALVRGGARRSVIARELAFGCDRDPLAAAIARSALALWAQTPVPAEHFLAGDSLLDPAVGPPEVEVVVGNPPFLNQLGRRTTRDRDGAARLKERFPNEMSAYVDSASLFLVVGLERLVSDGRMALIQPLSFLATRDAAGVRARLTADGDLIGLWLASGHVFSAAVDVCAPIVARAPSTPGVKRWTGIAMDERPGASSVPDAASWGPLSAPLLGIPEIDLARSQAGETAGADDHHAADDGGGTVIGDEASATAGFRDEYYAVAEVVTELADLPPGTRAADVRTVVTSGAVDSLRLLVGERPSRIRRRAWTHPVVRPDDVAEASERVGRWVERLAEPKLLVATQTPTIEVVVDADGSLVPITPVIAVMAPVERLWPIAAALTSPAVTAIAAARTAGTARSTRAIKLAARQVLDLPLPAPSSAWDHAAAIAERLQTQAAMTVAARAAAFAELGRSMNEAYRLDATTGAEVLEWWLARLTGGRR